MNCKKGDLAIFVRSKAGNEGKIVTCLEFVGSHPYFPGGQIKDYWRLDTPVSQRACQVVNGKLVPLDFFFPPTPYASDSNLRPLRGEPSLEEMEWAERKLEDATQGKA